MIFQDYEETMQCVKNSFDGPNWQVDDNLILKDDAVSWKKYGHGYWPSVVINRRTFRGDLIPDNVFEAICSGFTTPPDYCVTF